LSSWLQPQDQLAGFVARRLQVLQPPRREPLRMRLYLAVKFADLDAST